jgi:hypothetical protein
VYVLDGPNLSAFRNKDVNAMPAVPVPVPVPVFGMARWPATEPMAPTRLDAGHHRVGAREEQGGVHELVHRRDPGEEHDDSRKYPLPRTAFQTAPVDRPLGVPKSDQFAHSRDPEREIPTKTRGAAKNVGVHDDDRG